MSIDEQDTKLNIEGPADTREEIEEVLIEERKKLDSMYELLKEHLTPLETFGFSFYEELTETKITNAYSTMLLTEEHPDQVSYRGGSESEIAEATIKFHGIEIAKSALLFRMENEDNFKSNMPVEDCTAKFMSSTAAQLPAASKEADLESLRVVFNVMLTYI